MVFYFLPVRPRAVLYRHKECLKGLRDFWKLMTSKTAAKPDRIEEGLRELDAVTDRAHRAYKM